eukprot:5100390-Lingulodinium_polyedra.AAC.1
MLLPRSRLWSFAFYVEQFVQFVSLQRVGVRAPMRVELNWAAASHEPAVVAVALAPGASIGRVP